jgi:hypothetical protein
MRVVGQQRDAMTKTNATIHYSVRPSAFLIDLVIYLVVMFGVRELYVSGLGFIANALLMSCATLIVASWRMKVRGITWRDLGFRNPDRYLKTQVATGAILAMAIGGIIFFEILKDSFFPGLAEDVSDEAATSKFGDLTASGCHSGPRGSAV